MNLVAAVALASFVAAPVPKDPPKPESPDGEWRVVQILHGGQMRDRVTVATFTIKGDTMTIKEGERVEEVMSITLDPKASPATIDLREARGGKPSEKVIPGIYLLEKDKLTICFSVGGDERPKEFKSEAGSKTGLLVLERVKK